MFSLGWEEHAAHMKRMRSARLEFKIKCYLLLSLSALVIFGGFWLMMIGGVMAPKIIAALGMVAFGMSGIDALVKYRRLDRFVKDSGDLAPEKNEDRA
jgi:hypothetical protein